MATIQAYYFTKNNNVDWGNCNATLADTMRCEAVVSFSGAEIGKRYNVDWLIYPPTGSYFYMVSPTLTVVSTETFVSSIIPNLQAGTYRIADLIINQMP